MVKNIITKSQILTLILLCVFLCLPAISFSANYYSITDQTQNPQYVGQPTQIKVQINPIVLPFNATVRVRSKLEGAVYWQADAEMVNQGNGVYVKTGPARTNTKKIIYEVWVRAANNDNYGTSGVRTLDILNADFHITDQTINPQYVGNKVAIKAKVDNVVDEVRVRSKTEDMPNWWVGPGGPEGEIMSPNGNGNYEITAQNPRTNTKSVIYEVRAFKAETAVATTGVKTLLIKDTALPVTEDRTPKTQYIGNRLYVKVKIPAGFSEVKVQSRRKGITVDPNWDQTKLATLENGYYIARSENPWRGNPVTVEYRIQAKNSAGNVVYSSISEFKVENLIVDDQTPKTQYAGNRLTVKLKPQAGFTEIKINSRLKGAANWNISPDANVTIENGYYIATSANPWTGNPATVEYRLQAKDSSGTIVYSGVSEFNIINVADTTGPTIENLTVSTQEIGKIIQYRAKIIDPDGVNSVVIRGKTAGSPDWQQEKPMQLLDAGQNLYGLDTQVINNPVNIIYEIEAKDTLGNINKLDSSIIITGSTGNPMPWETIVKVDAYSKFIIKANFTGAPPPGGGGKNDEWYDECDKALSEWYPDKKNTNANNIDMQIAQSRYAFQYNPQAGIAWYLRDFKDGSNSDGSKNWAGKKFIRANIIIPDNTGGATEAKLAILTRPDEKWHESGVVSVNSGNNTLNFPIVGIPNLNHVKMAAVIVYHRIPIGNIPWHDNNTVDRSYLNGNQGALAAGTRTWHVDPASSGDALSIIAQGSKLKLEFHETTGNAAQATYYIPRSNQWSLDEDWRKVNQLQFTVDVPANTFIEPYDLRATLVAVSGDGNIYREGPRISLTQGITNNVTLNLSFISNMNKIKKIGILIQHVGTDGNPNDSAQEVYLDNIKFTNPFNAQPQIYLDNAGVDKNGNYGP